MLIKSNHCANFLRATIFAQSTIKVSIISRMGQLKSIRSARLSGKDYRRGEKRKLIWMVERKGVGNPRQDCHLTADWFSYLHYLHTSELYSMCRNQGYL